tara:strand:- start:2360 stop:3313 length:954 start_codon:yes stop_codon:yes gene_type:complete
MENIAILTGGDSKEYNISLLSANTVLKNLNKHKYKGVIVHLKDGEYTIKKHTLDTSDFSYIKNNEKIKFDKIFIALHGPPAENGLIQEYFERKGIPYTSCDAKTSKLTFNKFECNKKLRTLGFRCPKSILINSAEKHTDIQIIKRINLPFFVKPNGSGSSYGISKVTERTNISDSINKAFQHDQEVIIESLIAGTEVSCGVYFDGSEIIALPITEIVTNNDFFDYKAKYEGESEEITPARIDNNLTLEIQQKTIDIYKEMNLSGICRIDFIIEKKKVYIIEINTIPGLSENSIIPKQLEVANISLSDFFDLCLSKIN